MKGSNKFAHTKKRKKLKGPNHEAQMSNLKESRIRIKGYNTALQASGERGGKNLAFILRF